MEPVFGYRSMKMSTKNRFGQRLFAPCIVSTLNTLNGRAQESALREIFLFCCFLNDRFKAHSALREFLEVQPCGFS